MTDVIPIKPGFQVFYAWLSDARCRKRTTEAEKCRTLAQVLAVTVPAAALIGLGLGWLIGDSGESMAAGAVIGFFVTARIVTFDVSRAVGLIPRRRRESPFLVALVTRSLVWLVVTKEQPEEATGKSAIA